jgi:two-component system sensor histidine kinase EvgS
MSVIPAKVQAILTKEEQDYIDKRNVIKAVSIHGAAPIQYADANGEVKGISKELLDKISSMTGLVFEYQLHDTFDEAFNSGADIIFGIPYNYAPEDMVMSIPFLESETILYLNSSVDPNELDDKKICCCQR